MNWIERINNTELSIRTADGKVYKPLWIKAEKNINFNTEGFDFRGVDGTFVAKQKASGAQYPFTFYFQGADHLDTAKAFLASAKDTRPATISHPYYDNFKAQILSLSQQNTTQNISEFSGVLWETIAQDYPSETIDPKSIIISKKATIDKLVYDNYTTTFDPSASDVQPSTLTTQVIASNYEQIGDSSILKDYARAAEIAASNILSSTDNFLLSTTALINYPFEAVGSVKQKLNSILQSVANVYEVIENINFDTIASILVSESCVVGINSEYSTTTEVLDAIDVISATYQFILNAFDNDNYNQKAEIAIALDEVVNTTIASLFVVAFNAKQERTYTLPKDDNLINLAHLLYGDEESDIQLMIEENNITLDEYITIAKGREIKYFV